MAAGVHDAGVAAGGGGRARAWVFSLRGRPARSCRWLAIACRWWRAGIDARVRFGRTAPSRPGRAVLLLGTFSRAPLCAEYLVAADQTVHSLVYCSWRVLTLFAITLAALDSLGILGVLLCLLV